MSSSGAPPPRGILKNRQSTGSSSGDRNGDGNLGYGGFGSGSITGNSHGWGMGSILSAQSSQGAGTVDLTSSLLNLDSG